MSYYLAPTVPTSSEAYGLKGSDRPKEAYQLFFPDRPGGILYLGDDHEVQGLVKLAEDKHDTSQATSDILGSQKPFNEQVAQIWAPYLRPNHTRYEIWCGPRHDPLLWEHPLDHVNPMKSRVIARDFLHNKSKRNRLIHKFGLLTIVSGLVYLGVVDPIGLMGLTTLASDVFTDTNGVALTTHSANWTYVATGAAFSIQSNAVCPTGSAASGWGARYSGIVWPDDHWSEGTFPAITGSTFQLGPGARIQTHATQNNSYGFVATGGGVSRRFLRWTNDAPTQFGITVVSVLNHTLKIGAVGSTITAYYDGVLDTVMATNPATDATYPTGSSGIKGFNTTTLLLMDNWSGGDFIESGSGEGTVVQHRLHKILLGF